MDTIQQLDNNLFAGILLILCFKAYLSYRKRIDAAMDNDLYERMDEESF